MTQEIQIKSKHNLPFEVAEWIFPQWVQFKVGTCYGLWRATDTSYDILAIDNKQKHNGHLDDVFEWFESSCIRDGKYLRILELWNQRFKKHLINKRGFEEIDKLTVIKKFL